MIDETDKCKGCDLYIKSILGCCPHATYLSIHRHGQEIIKFIPCYAKRVRGEAHNDLVDLGRVYI